MNVTIVDAFTRTPGAGNRAGVVTGAADLPAAEMRRVAAAVAASETAFVAATAPDVALRYFTPTDEIGFCGHATLATLHLLAERGLVGVPSRPTVACKAGRFAVELEPGRVWFETPLPPFAPSPLAGEQLFALLGADARTRDPELSIRRGGGYLYVPMARRSDLWSLAPRYHALAAAGNEHGIHGFYVFTRDVVEPASTVHARFFAPALGVNEDPVTGSASGPIGKYLVLHGASGTRFRAEQGDAMGKPGRVDIRVEGESVRIGGEAVTVMDAVLAPPSVR